jgi:hypothetical protein
MWKHIDRPIAIDINLIPLMRIGAHMNISGTNFAGKRPSSSCEGPLGLVLFRSAKRLPRDSGSSSPPKEKEGEDMPGDVLTPFFNPHHSPSISKPSLGFSPRTGREKGNFMRKESPPADPDLQLLWGAKNIGRAIGRTARETMYLLESGKLPARKVGRMWCSSRPALRQHFAVEVNPPQ